MVYEVQVKQIPEQVKKDLELKKNRYRSMYVYHEKMESCGTGRLVRISL